MVGKRLRSLFSSRRVFQYELGFHPQYWRLRKKVRRAAFNLRAILFKRRLAAKRFGRGAAILGQLVSLIAWQVLSAIFSVAALAILSKYITDWVGPLFPISKDAEINYLSTLGQVSAGLLALYFTAISVVVSTAYSRVPGDIRGLIMREEVGSFYFKSLAFFAAVITITLTAVVFELPIGPLNILFVTSLCLLAIYSFVILGVRAFDYFEPTSLLPYVSRDLQSAISLVTPNHPHWLDESFQAHHQGEAERLLNSYNNLVTLSIDKRNGTALQEIAAHLIGTTAFYFERKHAIPSNSFWFARTYKHKDWLTTSYSEVGIALATGTAIRPESVPNHYWFEESVMRILSRGLRPMGDFGAQSASVQIAYRVNNAFNILGRQFLVDEAALAIRELGKVVKDESTRLPSSAFPSDLTPVQETLALLDAYTSWPTNFVLGFAAAFETLTVDRLVIVLKSTEASRPGALYRNQPIPRMTIQKLEFVWKAMIFERRVLGHSLSPIWFRVETCANSLSEFLRVSCDKIIEQFEEMYGDHANSHIVAKRYVAAALISQKGLEGCSKLRHMFARLAHIHGSYLETDQSKEYTWPTIDWEHLDARASALRDRLLLSLSKCLPELGTGEVINRLPDFFGAAYSFVADACFDAALRGRHDLFLELFTRFFDAAFQAFGRLRARFGTDHRQAVIVFEPLADLMSVSGYSFVLSDLNSSNIATIVESCWNTYFSTLPSDPARQAVVNVLYAVVAPSLPLASREMLRSRWKQAMRDLLRNRGLMSDTWSSRFHRTQSVSHPSALVRAFADRIDIFTDGEDVFLSKYISARPESEPAKPPMRVASFIKTLAREEQASATGSVQPSDSTKK